MAYLQSNPAPDVVYCENDNMCFGVMQALDELGIAYGDGGVTLISFDAGRTALSYCKDGKIDLCAECNPLHGPRVRALIEQLARGETPEKLSNMPEALFTADTLTAAPRKPRLLRLPSQGSCQQSWLRGCSKFATCCLRIFATNRRCSLNLSGCTFLHWISYGFARTQGSPLRGAVTEGD